MGVSGSAVLLRRCSILTKRSHLRHLRVLQWQTKFTQ
jgi:hypothetical protein